VKDFPDAPGVSMKRILVGAFALSGLVFLYSLSVIVGDIPCDARCQQSYEKRVEAYAKQLRECGSLMAKERGEDNDRP